MTEYLRTAAHPSNTTAPHAIRHSPSPLKRAWRRFKQHRLGYWSLILFVGLFVFSLCGEVISNDRPLVVKYHGTWYFPIVKTYPETAFGGDFPTPTDYLDPYIRDKFKEPGSFAIFPPNPYSYETLNYFSKEPNPAPPSAENWLGTDDLGRDILSRILNGAGTSALAPLLVVLGSTVLGALVGVLAAWFGGAVDWILARLIDVVFAIPGLVLAVLAVAMFGKGVVAPVVALAIAYLPISARLIRTAALVELGKPYFEALRVQGVGRLAIWFRHLVPALLPVLLAQATVGFGYAMVDLAAISYLGLGQQPPTADWGVMIAVGQSSILAGHPEQSLFAALLVLLTVLAMNVLGARASTWAEGRNR